MTIAADAPLPHGTADTVLVPEGTAPSASAEQLLSRVHAKLSAVESNVAAAFWKMEAVAEKVLAFVARAEQPIAAAATAVAAVAPPPVSTIAKAIAALCGCGHDALHTKGGCTAANCTCKEPPPRSK